MSRVAASLQESVLEQSVDRDLDMLTRDLVAARDLRHGERGIRIQEFEDGAIGCRQAVSGEIGVCRLRHGPKQAPDQPDGLVLGGHRHHRVAFNN